MKKYRFDDAYEKVFKYDEGAKAYLFCGSYSAFGIDAKMSDEAKMVFVDEDPCWWDDE